MATGQHLQRATTPNLAALSLGTGVIFIGCCREPSLPYLVGKAGCGDKARGGKEWNGKQRHQATKLAREHRMSHGDVRVSGVWGTTTFFARVAA
jgi:hypothetical protein